MSLKGNALIGQSGGPTIVINASLVGAVQEAQKSDYIDRFFGGIHGLDGVLNEKLIDLFREDDAVIDGLKDTPSAALGSSRLKPQEADLARVLDVFKAHNIRYFFYIGGNDSQLTCHKISELAQGSDWEMRVMGIPKTIDNDLPMTDTCPGFGSAARYAASAVQYASKDAEAFGTGGVVEIMGRHAGWMTGAAQVGRLDDYMAPHLVYLPEVAVDIDDIATDAQAAFKKHGYVVVAVSEGLELTKSAEDEAKLDEFGHARLGGVAKALAGMLEEKIGVRFRHDTLGNLQRCFAASVSETDYNQAYAVGQEAVRLAVSGETGFMITIERESDEPYQWHLGITELMNVADKTRYVPREWVNEAGNGVTEEFIAYAKPLIQGRNIAMPTGIPAFPRLQKHFVEPKLEKHVRPK